MNSEVFVPKEIRRMIKLSPGTLRDWRARGIDHGTKRDTRSVYTAHGILRLHMMQKLTAARIDPLTAFRASILCAGQVCDFLGIARDQLAEIPTSTGQFAIFTFAPGEPLFTDNLSFNGAEEPVAEVLEGPLILFGIDALEENAFVLTNATEGAFFRVANGASSLSSSLLDEEDVQTGDYDIHWLEKWLDKQAEA